LRQATKTSAIFPSIVNRCSGIVLDSVPDIRKLRESAGHSLLRTDVLLDPEFFLASLSKGWSPRVVAVNRGTDLVGIVCAKERTFCGLRLGVIHADLTFGSYLLGDPRQRQEIMLFALEKLLASPATRGLRLKVRRGSPELAAVRRLLASTHLDVHFSRLKDHASLPLPDTYEQLLMNFGSTTRHNFRYYRRRFETAGHVYLNSLSLDEVRLAAFDLRPKCSRPGRLDAIEKFLNMAATAGRPLTAGLKGRNGEWLSVMCGVYRASSGVLLLQLNNDRDFPRDSLSVVLRAFLLESLIHQGVKEFIIWEGTGAPLSRYATQIPALGVYLDSPGYQWRLARLAVSTLAALLPEQHLKIYRRFH
jgi:hypothetical protein